MRTVASHPLAWTAVLLVCSIAHLPLSLGSADGPGRRQLRSSESFERKDISQATPFTCATNEMTLVVKTSTDLTGAASSVISVTGLSGWDQASGDIAVSTFEVQQIDQGCLDAGGREVAGKCLRPGNQPTISFTLAQGHCANLGGDFGGSFDNVADRTEVYALAATLQGATAANPDGGMWIPRFKESTGWAFTDGTAEGAFEWAPGEPAGGFPAQNCAYLDRGGTGGKDARCSASRNFVCSVPFNPEEVLIPVDDLICAGGQTNKGTWDAGTETFTMPVCSSQTIASSKTFMIKFNATNNRFAQAAASPSISATGSAVLASVSMNSTSRTVMNVDGGSLPFRLHRDWSYCKVCPDNSTTSSDYFYETDITECQCNAGVTGAHGQTCAPCQAGKYKDSKGSAACSNCTANTYYSLTGAAALSACLQCPSTSYSLEGSDERRDCTCNSGYSGSECTACPAGKYKEKAGNHECQLCAAGTYSTELGKTDSSCQTCPAMTTALPGSSIQSQCKCAPGYTGPSASCSACALGKYKDNLGSQSCDDCRPATYGPEVGANNTSQCVQCPVGASSFNGSTSVSQCFCPKGYVGLDAAPCTPCLAGTYKPSQGTGACSECGQGKYNPDLGSISESQCRSCPNNTNSVPSSDSLSDCICASGHYATGQPGLCLGCDPGTYKDFSGDGPCLACPQDKYSSTQAAVDIGQCLSCPDNSVSSAGSGKITNCSCNVGHTGLDGGPCSACSRGKYKSSKGSEECTRCLAGTYLAGTGAIMHIQCLGCPSNAHSPAGSPDLLDCICKPGYTGADGLPCSSCAAGTYKLLNGSAACESCEIGKYNTQLGRDTPCQVCPGNSTSEAASVQLLDCKCSPGFTGPDGTSCEYCLPGAYKSLMGSTQCIQCERGKYSGDLARGTPCTDCPVGADTPGQSSLLVTQCRCLAGYTGANGGLCSACKPGTWKDSDGAGICQMCPGGTYSPTPAAIAHTTCLPCPEHTFAGLGSPANTSCKCNAGYTGPDGGVCEACSGGSYKPVWGSAECVLCAESKYSDAIAAVSSSTCDECLPHSYSLSGSSDAQNCTCNAGYSGQDGSLCNGCDFGWFKPVRGPSRCLPCDPGEYSPRGSPICMDCEVDFYCNLNVVRTECPELTRSLARATGLHNCTCIPGYFANVSTGASWECEICEANFFCSGDLHHQACPEFSFSDPGSDSVEDCLCNHGYLRAGEICILPVCGDGVTEGLEECDDSNHIDMDGCSSNCTLECGFSCDGSGESYQCRSKCGDGVKALDEQCDDSNEYDGDGCSMICTIEDLWICFNVSLLENQEQRLNPGTMEPLDNETCIVHDCQDTRLNATIDVVHVVLHTFSVGAISANVFALGLNTLSAALSGAAPGTAASSDTLDMMDQLQFMYIMGRVGGDSKGTPELRRFGNGFAVYMFKFPKYLNFGDDDATSSRRSGRRSECTSNDGEEFIQRLLDMFLVLVLVFFIRTLVQLAILFCSSSGATDMLAFPLFEAPIALCMYFPMCEVASSTMTSGCDSWTSVAACFFLFAPGMVACFCVWKVKKLHDNKELEFIANERITYKQALKQVRDEGQGTIGRMTMFKDIFQTKMRFGGAWSGKPEILRSWGILCAGLTGGLVLFFGWTMAEKMLLALSAWLADGTPNGTLVMLLKWIDWGLLLFLRPVVDRKAEVQRILREGCNNLALAGLAIPMMAGLSTIPVGFSVAMATLAGLVASIAALVAPVLDLIEYIKSVFSVGGVRPGPLSAATSVGVVWVKATVIDRAKEKIRKRRERRKKAKEQESKEQEKAGAEDEIKAREVVVENDSSGSSNADKGNSSSRYVSNSGSLDQVDISLQDDLSRGFVIGIPVDGRRNTQQRVEPHPVKNFRDLPSFELPLRASTTGMQKKPAIQESPHPASESMMISSFQRVQLDGFSDGEVVPRPRTVELTDVLAQHGLHSDQKALETQMQSNSASKADSSAVLADSGYAAHSSSDSENPLTSTTSQIVPVLLSDPLRHFPDPTLSASGAGDPHNPRATDMGVGPAMLSDPLQHKQDSQVSKMQATTPRIKEPRLIRTLSPCTPRQEEVLNTRATPVAQVGMEAVGTELIKNPEPSASMRDDLSRKVCEPAQEPDGRLLDASLMEASDLMLKTAMMGTYTLSSDLVRPSVRMPVPMAADSEPEEEDMATAILSLPPDDERTAGATLHEVEPISSSEQVMLDARQQSWGGNAPAPARSKLAL